jgi:tRNA pseudouridine55 synthase
MDHRLNGLLLVDKPLGWTSFDVVNRIRHTIQAGGLNTTGKKRFPVGHAGTLDPLATGLLIVMLGDYTKKAEEFTKKDKVYEVTARLGVTSTTGDEEGEKTSVSNKQPASEELNKAIVSFLGPQQQVPPQYSAVKVGGKRAYQLARDGKTVEIQPRTVKIYSITGVEYNYPDVTFIVEVSSGTYIRTLVSDLGQTLGTGAYTTALRRTSIGNYQVKDALSVDKLDAETIFQKQQTVIAQKK